MSRRQGDAVKIYRCNFHDTGEGVLVSWHGSKREAEKALRDLQRAARENGDGQQGPDHVKAVDLPTDKSGLLSWLNAYFNRDNE
jgi:hypothetical protein